MKSQKRNLVLDGVKGIAILIVLIHHFALAFYPSIIGGVSGQINTKSGIELFLYKTPLSIFFAGYFSVSIFFVITGYILTKKVAANKDNPSYVLNASINRVFRLMPLVIIVLLVGYIFMKFNLTFNVDVDKFTKSNWLATFFPLGTVSIEKILIDIFTRIPFSGFSEYYNILWIISYELFGSWFVYSASYFLHRDKVRFKMYLILLLALYNTHFVSFLLGMIIAENEEMIHFKQYVYYLGFIISLIFGSSTITAIDIKALAPFASFFKSIAAALFILSFMKIEWLKKLSELKIFVYFGHNSYYYYLTHMVVLIGLPSYIFLRLIPIMRYSQVTLITFITYVVCVVIYSNLLKKLESMFFKKIL